MKCWIIFTWIRRNFCKFQIKFDENFNRILEKYCENFEKISIYHKISRKLFRQFNANFGKVFKNLKKLTKLWWKFIKEIMEKFLRNFGKFWSDWTFLRKFWQTSYFILENSRKTWKWFLMRWEVSESFDRILRKFWENIQPIYKILKFLGKFLSIVYV